MLRYRLSTLMLITALSAAGVWLAHSMLQTRRATAHLQACGAELADWEGALWPVPRTISFWNCDSGVVNVECLPLLRWIQPHSLDLTGLRLGDDDLEQHLPPLTELVDLNLSSTSIQGRTLSKLQHCRKLRSLDLSNTMLTDESLELVSELSSLEELRVNQSVISGLGLKAFAEKSTLRVLEVRQTALREEGCRIIGMLITLERIDLSSTAVDDAGLACLATCTSLREIKAAHTHIRGTTLDSLQSLQELEVLHLGKGLPSFAGYTPWCDCEDFSATMSNIVHGTPLRESKCRVRLAKLPLLPRLRSIDLTCAVLETEDLERLAQLPSLEDVCLDATNVTDAMLSKLESSKSLKRISAIGTQITEQVASQFARQGHIRLVTTAPAPIRPLILCP